MRIITNPGLNLSAEEIQRHRVVIMPQRIMVDGEEHDTRSRISFAEIDRWMRDAKQVPHIVGTTAAEFIDTFRRAAAEDPELLVVTASRKLIGTNQAAVSAARAYTAMPANAHTRVVPIDCGSVDLPGAFCVGYAAEAAAAGHPLERVGEETRAFAAATSTITVPGTLDYLVKGGRASFLRALVANTLNLSPLIGFVDGEMRPIGTVKRGEMVSAMRDHVVASAPRGARVWIGIAHGGNDAGAQALARELSAAFSVRRLVVRPLCATTYLNLGPQSLALSFTKIDELPWSPDDPQHVPRRASGNPVSG
jgi:DegV family protein with EDD domain